MQKYTIYLIKENSNSNIEKIKFVNTMSNKKDILKDLKNFLKKKLKNDNIINKHKIVLFKFEKVNYNPNQPIKMVFGPIKISIDFYEITKRFSIKKNYDEKKDNYLFLPKEWIETNIKKNDFSDFSFKKYFKKMILLAYQNKLESRLLAPKTIYQLN